MTLPVDSQTPLLLASEYAALTNANTATWGTSDYAQIRDRLLEASQLLQALCRRRFDEYVETRYYTPFSTSGTGGGLLTPHELELDADLKTLSSIINANSQSIDITTVKLTPLNSLYKKTIRLNPMGTLFWVWAGINDFVGSVQITGTWGYGGSWIATGTTLGADATLNATTITVVSGASLEVGMVVQIDAEQMLVTAITANAITVTRAFNGTTATTHLNTTAISRWQALAVVRRLVKRLAQWMGEQNKAPLFGQAVVGDMAIPVVTDGMPKDVMISITQANLYLGGKIVGI